MATVVKSFSIQGIDAYPVDIETKIMEGQPMISIIGLGDQAVKEAAERIQSAIDESGYEFPKKKVIISLTPSDKKKCGSHFDLAMAVGVLKQAELIDAKNILQDGLIGELSLVGRLRPSRGILPMIIAAKKHGYKSVIVPRENMVEKECYPKLLKSVWLLTLASQRMMRINLIAFLRREAIMRLSSRARANGFTQGFIMTKVSLGHPMLIEKPFKE